MIEDITCESRIYIPKESISYTRLIETQSIIKELKDENPEILSLCVYGSSIKGVSTLESDIDGWLFVDSQLLAVEMGIEEVALLEKVPENFNDGKETIFFCEEIESYYDSLIKSRIKERLNLSDMQVEHLRTRPISKNIIDYNLKYYKRWANKEVRYRRHQDSLNRFMDYIGRPPIYSGCLNTGCLPYIFHMTIGQGVEYYRSYLVAKLLNMGTKGEIVWSEIIESVEAMENRFRIKTGIKYPRTLIEAKEIYLT